MAVNERAKTTVYLDGKQAEAALDALGNKAKSLRKDLVDAQKAGDNVQMKNIERELKRVEAAQRSLKKETFDVEAVLKDINKVSLRDLEKAQRAVRAQMKGMTRDAKEYTDKEKDLKLITSELNKARGTMRSQQSLWGQMADGANKYATIMAGVLATITGIAFSVREWIKGIVGLDDALANVQKTTGMTRTQVREMYQDFRTFNTRTPRKELLLLAEEAGRLGKRSRQDVMSFIEVANQIQVALGDDLGGNAAEAIREVGKLTEIYKVGGQYGTDFKESMLKVGSAINEVSANSNAQAPFLIDYLKRMGGVAVQSKVNAAEIIGYASALDQLGQTQEMSATAQGKIMIDMFKDSAKYANIARMSTADFSLLLARDANEAFLKVLEGLNGNNEGMTVMAKKMDALGVDGARAVQVLAAMASNTGMIREQQALANKAMDEGVSLTNEYTIKNNNLAGSWEKIGQFIQSKFVNSSFLGWLEKVVGKVGEWTEIKLSDTLQKERSEVNLLVTAITHVSNSQETRNKLIQELQDKYPDFLKNLDTEKVTNEELRNRLKEVNDQYETRILLAIKEEALKDNYKERLQLKLDELDAIKQIAKYEEIANQARAKAANETDPNKLRALLSDQEITALNAMDLLPKKLEGIRSRFSELVDQEAELNNAVGDLQSKIAGLGSSGGDGGAGGTGGSGGGTFVPSTAEVDKTEVGKLDLGDKVGLDLDIQALQDQYDVRKMMESDWTKFLESETERQADALAKQFQVEQEIADAREDLKAMQISGIGQIAGALTGLAEQGSAAYILLLALEKASALATIWINLAKEKSAIAVQAAALGPIIGPPYAAAMTAKAILGAKINTGIVVAQAIGQVAGGSKKKKSGSKKSGGFAETASSDDEVMGVYHANEWIANANSVRGNRPFFNMLNQLQQSGSMDRIDLTPVVNAMTSGSGRKSGGFGSSDGGSDSSLQQPYTNDPELKAMLTSLMYRLDNPVAPELPIAGSKGVAKRLDDYNRFKGKVSRKKS
ncbi:phage tail tape measure protein [Mangrovibacterium sp.]|uniref:phage tail tape measure protein n=1 Tax=Mangrovibacterium sp. TaxID=1961364 RepID=UPI0035671502